MVNTSTPNIEAAQTSQNILRVCQQTEVLFKWSIYDFKFYFWVLLWQIKP